LYLAFLGFVLLDFIGRDIEQSNLAMDRSRFVGLQLPVLS
jgi:hypothetical protein